VASVIYQALHAGMLCDVAGNGKEALAAIEAGASNSYDLVLMDLVMPEMDGATATRILRKKEEEQGGAVQVESS
jgi:CheY-like chemotaxis protein